MIFSLFKMPILVFLVFFSFFFGFDGTSGPYVAFAGRDGQVFVFVEIADDPDERVLGLRNRVFLGDDEGMWFIFPDSQKRVFTMKDVLIPLDMVFLDERLVVTEIYANRLPAATDSLTYSEFPARYVLELRGSRAEELGLETGMRLQFFQ